MINEIYMRAYYMYPKLALIEIIHRGVLDSVKERELTKHQKTLFNELLIILPEGISAIEHYIETGDISYIAGIDKKIELISKKIDSFDPISMPKFNITDN